MLATVLTITAVVAPFGHAEAQRPIPRVLALAATVSGSEATYERITPCIAYVYGYGVVGKLNACGRVWKLSVTNTSRHKRTVKILVRTS